MDEDNLDIPDFSDLPEPFIPGSETVEVLELEATDAALSSESGLATRQQACLGMDFPFHFDPDCPVCDLATNDQTIHRTYIVNDRQSSAVMQYLNERYPDTSVSWNCVDNHLRNHFTPVHDAPETMRQNYAASIRAAARIRFETSPEDQLASMGEIVSQTIEDLKVKQGGGVDIDTGINIAKTIGTLVNCNVKVIETKLKIEENKQTTEDISERANVLIEQRMTMIIEAISESARDEVMQAIDSMRRVSRNSD